MVCWVNISLTKDVLKHVHLEDEFVLLITGRLTWSPENCSEPLSTRAFAVNRLFLALCDCYPAAGWGEGAVMGGVLSVLVNQVYVLENAHPQPSCWRFSISMFMIIMLATLQGHRTEVQDYKRGKGTSLKRPYDRPRYDIHKQQWKCYYF